MALAVIYTLVGRVISINLIRFYTIRPPTERQTETIYLTRSHIPGPFQTVGVSLSCHFSVQLIQIKEADIPSLEDMARYCWRLFLDINTATPNIFLICKNPFPVFTNNGKVLSKLSTKSF